MKTVERGLASRALRRSARRAVALCTILMAVTAIARASQLSDNLSEYPSGDEFATSSHWICSSFGTDAKAYNLTGVVLATGGSSGLDSDVVLEIYTSTGTGVGQPGVLVGTLTTPEHVTQPYTTFLAQGIVLSPSSTYWVVLRVKPGSSTIDWNWTLSVGHSGVGFQCTWGISDDGGATWATYHGFSPQLMSVNAQPMPWTDQGLALAGLHGNPQLDGAGTLEAGSPGSIMLYHAKPLALAYLIAGLVPLDAPFKGGTMVPTPQLVLPLATNASGGLSLSWSHWPAALPSGTELLMQCWIVDPAGPAGFAASNGLSATTP